MISAEVSQVLLLPAVQGMADLKILREEKEEVKQRRGGEQWIR